MDRNPNETPEELRAIRRQPTFIDFLENEFEDGDDLFDINHEESRAQAAN